MAFQPAFGCCQVTMHWQDTSTNTFIGENTLTFYNGTESGWTSLELEALLAGIGGWYADTFKGVISAAARLQRLTARDLSDQYAEYAELLTASVGTYAGDRVPANVTAAIAFRSQYAMRSARGRFFLVGIPAAVVIEDNITSVYSINVIQAFEDLNLALPAGNTHVIVSRYFNQVKRVSAQEFPVTTYGFADLRIDTRRNRLRRQL